MIPSIVKILKVEAFKVLVTWNNGELRVIDFAKNFDTWKKENNNILFPLMNEVLFKEVSISESGTLQWKNIPTKFVWKGQERTEPLELDPIVLYEQSKELSHYALVEVEKSS
jgi:hypothetical protein